VLPVEDPGNGNRWRESTARRPVIEVGKTSRPLSADEIRKAKLRARIMQLPTTGTSGHKSGSTQEPYSSRGKPTPVGDGWSLDRYASMDGGDKPTQDGLGASFPRPTTSNVDTTFAPKQILDEKTFDQLLAEQAAEADAAEAKAVEAKVAEAKVLGSEQTINTRSPIRVNTLEQGSESTGHLHDVYLPESESNLDLDTSFQQATAIVVDSQPLSPSIAVALCENSSETFSEVAEDTGVINDPVNLSSEQPVVGTVAEDSVMEQAPVESGPLDVIPSEPVNDKVIEACLIPWVVPPGLYFSVIHFPIHDFTSCAFVFLDSVDNGHCNSVELAHMLLETRTRLHSRRLLVNEAVYFECVVTYILFNFLSNVSVNFLM
jgi:hypothetical protein